MKSRLIILTVFFTVIFNLTALAAKTDSHKNHDHSKHAADSIAVIVNGVNITESQIEAEMKPQIERMARQAPPDFIEQYKGRIRQQVIEKLIVESLLDEKVKQNKVTVTDADVTNHIKEMVSQQKPPLSLDQYKQLLQKYGKDYEETKRSVQKGLRYKKLLEAQWADKINITEEDLRKYYNDNKKQYETPEQVRASHILIKPDMSAPGTDPNEAKAKALAKIKKLLKQVKKGGDFAKLAKDNSSCPSAARGGDLDFFGKGQMVPPFEKAAFALKKGQVSDVVETRFGYHIIKVTDHKKAGFVPFEETKKDIKETIDKSKQAEFTNKYIESLKAEAKITYKSLSAPKTVITPKGSVK